MPWTWSNGYAVLVVCTWCGRRFVVWTLCRLPGRFLTRRNACSPYSPREPRAIWCAHDPGPLTPGYAGAAMPTVYFFMMHDPADPQRDFQQVKVGITGGDVARRIAQLQTGNPFELRCVDSFETPCARRVEHFLHRTHAAKMQHLEWLRWPRSEVHELIDEAKQAARRIEERASREERFASQPSNGIVRRPSREEIDLHMEARSFKTRLVPEMLRRQIAESLLTAATGSTLGIEGIVRVNRIEATIRFNPRLAEERFPALVDRCRVSKTEGRFCWLKTPPPRSFAVANEEAKRALAAAGAAGIAHSPQDPRQAGGNPPTPEERRGECEFLRATQQVTHLEADLADLQTELTIRLGEDEGLVGLCSYKRYARARIDQVRFRELFPSEAAQCEEPIPAQLRKRVYPTRSYW